MSRVVALVFVALLLAAAAPIALASGGNYVYTFNAADQLVAVSSGGMQVAVFTYDGDNLRVSKTAAGAGTIFVRGASGEVLAEYSATGDLLAEYVYLDGKRLCKITTDAKGTEHRTYYHDDLVGTPLALTDETGNIAARGEYYPFGDEVVADAIPDPHKFTGKELDEEIGLYYFNARYYDAQIGRFVSVDPVGGVNLDPQSWNRYAYGLNNPLAFIDPDGRDALAVTFPDYRVGGRQTGHSGIVLINPDTGYTRYFEYGRYDTENRGLVRTRTIPNVVMGEDGRPTQESMDNLLQVLSGRYGQGGAVEGAYFRDANYLEMLEYAENLQTTTEEGQGRQYSVLWNNCATFCEDVLETGGVDTPITMVNSPRNVIEGLQDDADAVYRYVPPEGN